MLDPQSFFKLLFVTPGDDLFNAVLHDDLHSPIEGCFGVMNAAEVDDGRLRNADKIIAKEGFQFIQRFAEKVALL